MKIRLWLILVLFLFFRMDTVFSDDTPLVITADMQYGYALSLFNKKDYQAAATEFKRFVHFFPEHVKSDQAQFYIGRCQYEQKQYMEAAKTFNQIILKDKQENDSLIAQSYFYQSRAFMEQGNTGYAKLVLHNFSKLTDDPDVKDEIYVNLARIHLADASEGHEDSLAQARTNLLKISKTGWEKYRVDAYLDLVTRTENLPQKDPVLAGLLAVVPGAGFFYCNRYKDAFVTLLLNAGLVISAYEAWENGNEALAGVIGFVETGFYTGNIYGSISSAHKYNQIQKQGLLNQRFTIFPKVDPERNRIGLSLRHTF